MSFDPATEGWRPMKTNVMPCGIGMPWAKRADGAWRYGMTAAEAHLNPGGVVHGGILMTFADHTLGLYAWEKAGRVPLVTVQLNTHFMGAVHPGDFMELRGEVVRATRQMAFVRGTIAVRGTDVVALDGIWRIFPGEKAPK